MVTKEVSAVNTAGNIEVVRPPPLEMRHLDPMVIEIEFEPEKGSPRVRVPILVHYANHCFTRTRRPDDADEDVLFREWRNGRFEERVWCEDRARFSQQLPAIMSRLGSLLCMRGDQKEMMYRVEGPGPRKGESWYVCMKMSLKRATGEVFISVRSVHARTNKPLTRGAPARGWSIFGALYKVWREQNPAVRRHEKENPLR